MNHLTAAEIEKLIATALEARQLAYVPYSGFAVGASLMTEAGEIYTGCNIENASYGATNCAERTAFFKAVSEGERMFKAIAVTGGKKECEPSEYIYPCGICRQVMQEFGTDSLQIIIAKDLSDYKIYSLSELLPCGFGGESIQ